MLPTRQTGEHESALHIPSMQGVTRSRCHDAAAAAAALITVRFMVSDALACESDPCSGTAYKDFRGNGILVCISSRNALGCGSTRCSPKKGCDQNLQIAGASSLPPPLPSRTELWMLAPAPCFPLPSRKSCGCTHGCVGAHPPCWQRSRELMLTSAWPRACPWRAQ